MFADGINKKGSEPNQSHANTINMHDSCQIFAENSGQSNIPQSRFSKYLP